MSDDNLSRIMCKIDPDLKDDLKVIALRKKTTMTDIIVKEIEKYVDKNKELL